MRFLIAFFSLFLFVAPGFAQNYTLQPGDVVSVEVLEDSSLNRRTLVLPDGSLNFPFAGSIRASGRTVSQIESSLRSALAPNFATEPTVFVSVSTLAPGESSIDTITIFVIGEVGSPGPKDIERGQTFLQALASTGGFTAFAATKRIQLRRTDPSTGQEAIYKFNLKAAGDGARISGNTVLRDGDVILVPERRLFE